jgi:glycoside/pentoside/hexuronide:cation symporter, GPH family
MTEHKQSGSHPRHLARLSRKVLGAYSGPAFSQSFLMGPAISVLQGIYAKYFGLGLAQIALVLLIARIFNAVSDPVIGYLSDRYRARHGSRKPWLIGGSLVAVFACWFLYVPAGRVTTLSFLCWFLLADIGWSMSAVPYSAWMAEITEDYRERTRIASWRAVGTYLGYLAFFGMPLAAGVFLGTTEFTPVTLRWSAIFAAIALPVTALIAVLVVPNGTTPAPPAANPLKGAIRAVAGNRPLWMFVAMFAVGGLGGGMGWGLVYFYIDGYLGLGAKLSGLLVLSIPVAILATPVWGVLCRRFGKQQMWAAGYVGAAVAALGYAFISPGPLSVVWVGLILLLLNALVVVDPIAGPAVLADVIDYGRWRFGADYGGTYFALYGMIQKINIGIGAAIGLTLAGAFGFNAKVATQTSGGLRGLLLAFSVFPAILYLVAAVMIWRFPINQQRQRAIVRAIERRQESRQP